MAADLSGACDGNDAMRPPCVTEFLSAKQVQGASVL